MTKRVGMVGAMALTMVTVSGVGAQGVQEALRAAQELQAVEAVVQAELAVAMPRVQAALALCDTRQPAAGVQFQHHYLHHQC